jgi:tetratricopeptide (TPR) repeat protein
MSASAFSDAPGLLLPVGNLPDYPLMVVMTYLQGIYKPATGHTWTVPQGRNWRHRSKLVVPTAYDVDWYRPLGPVTGINYSNEFFELLEQQYRWAALSALRLTCKRFANLSEKVVPLFSLLRQLRIGTLSVGAIPRPLTVSTTPEHGENQPKELPWITPTELLLMQSSGVKSGILKPHLFRSRSSAPLPLPEPRMEPTTEPADAETQTAIQPAEWYGNLARHVHAAFGPLVLPSAYEAPLSALQISSSAQRHYFSLKRSLGFMLDSYYQLLQNTTIDYFIGEWRKRMEEDCETHVRFRLKIEIKGDRELEAPPRYLHFKSVVVQATSFVHARSAEDVERDPLNLSPFFIRKPTHGFTMRPPQGSVGLHMLAVETDDAILAAALDLPSVDSGCSTIVMMIENGARGILEPHTRSDPRVFVPVMLVRTQFLNALATLLEMPTESPQELKESASSISQWLSAVSMVDYSTPLAPQRKYDMDRMYSYSFLQLESPTQGPLSTSYILNPHAFHLEPEIGRFLGAAVESEYFTSSTELPATHSKSLSSNLAHFYHRSIDSILEQYRWANVVLPVLERLGRAELDSSMHGPLAQLCSRMKILDHSEVDLQCLPQAAPGSLELIPTSLYSTFEIRTNDPHISLRFTHRRYPMALSLSIVAPSTLEAWQWAAKNNMLLNYFHYGCTPFYVPMPDLSHLSERYTDVLSVTFLPTVAGAPQPTWTSDPLITNATLASTSVNCLEELETRDSVCFFRWDPSLKLEEWRKTAQQPHGVPVDLQLVETLAAAVGVPELSCDQFMTILIRAFGQGFGKIPQVTERTPPAAAPLPESPIHSQAFSTSSSATMTNIDGQSHQNHSPLEVSEDHSSLNLDISLATGAPTPELSSKVPTMSTSVPSNLERMQAFENASFFSARKLAPPFGSSRFRWRPTTLIVEAADTNWSCISISMIRQYSHLSQEQIRWADYSLLHPTDFGLPSSELSEKPASDQAIHPSNIYVDPAVVGHYPDHMHSVHIEKGVPFVLLLSAGEQVISMQLVKSVRKTTPRTSASSSPAQPNEPLPSLPKERSGGSHIKAPHYELNKSEEATTEEEAGFCVVWRRGQAFHVVTAHVELLQAKSIFAARFSVFTGQPWTLSCHTEGWTIAKTKPENLWEAPKTIFPSRYLQPTHLDPAVFYEYVPLTGSSNELLACLMPASSILRFWARFYRLVMADLPRSLDMIKLALINDEVGTEDRVLSLMEYAEWSRACGNAKATLEAVHAANMVDSAHPLPWLAKADLTYLASLQTTDPQNEMLRIEQAGALYSRFLTCARHIASLPAYINANPTNRDAQVNDLLAAADDKSESDNGNEATAVAQTEKASSGSLAAQTPSVLPVPLVSVMASKRDLITKFPSPMSLVHMRRAQWACGKLLQRLDRFPEAKSCYDELLRKYFKRERLELTLDRCATLLALRKPKEAAETMEHALDKESASLGSQGCAHSVYFRHVTALRARGWLLLSAAHLATHSVDQAVKALIQHRRLEPNEPRAMVLEVLIRQVRHASKPDTRTRMRQHGAQMMGMGQRPGPAPAPAVVGPGGQAQVAQAAPAQVMAHPNQPLQLTQAALAAVPPPALNINLILSALRNPNPRGLPKMKKGATSPPQTSETPTSSAAPEAAPSEPISRLVGSAPQRKLSTISHRWKTNQDSAASSSTPSPTVGAPIASSSTVNPTSMILDPIERTSSPMDEPTLEQEERQVNPMSESPDSPVDDPIVLKGSGEIPANLGEPKQEEGTPVGEQGQLGPLPASIRNAALFRRFYGFVRYSHWEMLIPLLSMMVDASSMRRKLLPPRLSYQTMDHSTLCLAEPTLLSALAILERIRDMVDEANLLGESDLNDTTREEYKLKLSDQIRSAENEYFDIMPHLRRLRISFFVSDEIAHVTNLLDASYACSVLQRALELNHDFVANSPSSSPHLAQIVTDSIKSENAAFSSIEPTAKSPIPALNILPHSTSPPCISSSMPKMETHNIETNPFGVDMNKASSSTQPLNPPPTLFSTSLVDHILRVQPPAFSSLIRRDSFPNSPDMPHPNFDIPENTFSSLPVKFVLDVLSEEVTLTLLDRSTTKGQLILNAVGLPKSLHHRIIAVQRRKPTPRPSVKSQTSVDPPASSPRVPPSPSKAPSSAPLQISPLHSTLPPPPTLLWHLVPAFSLPRILMKGLELNRKTATRSLTFSTAWGNYKLQPHSVAILVEVQLGSVYYCGPEQVTPPPGYDSLAIVNRFTKVKDDDGSEFFLPQNNDSGVPVFKVFDQSQIGTVRYILQDVDDSSSSTLGGQPRIF